MLLGVLAAGRVVHSATDLQATIKAHVDTEVRVKLSVTNLGDGTASALTPEAATDGDVRGAWVVPALEGGAATEWGIDLAPPASAGGFVVTGRIRYADGRGAWRSAVAGIVVCARDCGDPSVALTLPYGAIYVDRIGLVRLRLENRGTEVATGQLSLTLPTGLETQPPAAAVSIVPGATTDVDLTIENAGALTGGPYDALGAFAYTTGDLRRAVLVRSTITLPQSTIDDPRPDQGPPVLAAAVLGLVTLLGLKRLRGAREPWKIRPRPRSPRPASAK
jgi:hypothetical protein